MLSVLCRPPLESEDNEGNGTCIIPGGAVVDIGWDWVLALYGSCRLRQIDVQSWLTSRGAVHTLAVTSQAALCNAATLRHNMPVWKELFEMLEFADHVLAGGSQATVERVCCR